LLHEAFRLVAEGYASSEDVDAGKMILPTRPRLD